MVDYDFLTYSDLSDHADAPLKVGDAWGDRGQIIVAIGPPIHDSKDATVVVGYGPGPMPEIQRLLDSLAESASVD